MVTMIAQRHRSPRLVDGPSIIGSTDQVEPCYGNYFLLRSDCHRCNLLRIKNPTHAPVPFLYETRQLIRRLGVLKFRIASEPVERFGIKLSHRFLAIENMCIFI